ncbi:MAG: adenylate/guanylate cyclase domain-containing protein [Geminicoccaceae bacterium]
MESSRQERRLAAILAADVVGYSSKVEQDEAGTLARLGALRSDLVEPALAEHRGRLVKLIGDGLIAEFTSVVDAAACAVAIQARNGTGLSLRIGINLGDVVVQGTDLLGDGVNIAARLEGLAEPGGIVVSGTAYDHLHGQAGLAFASLGEQRLKNITRPVRAYRLVVGDGVPAPSPKIFERPSIAVLPFDNLSTDPDQAYFSDGITEDLITALSRFRDLRVLARHSSFALRGQALDALEIGRRLGVGYLLEGSVRKLGPRVRVTAQLIDASGGDHLWAERYDRPLDDIFTLQDELVATIASTLAGRIHAAGVDRAKRKPTTDLAAYDHLLRGMERLGSFEAGANEASVEHFERAVALDPHYALANAYLALAVFNLPWGERADDYLARAHALATRAVELDPADSRCHRILAMILLNRREFDRAEHHADRSAALNPNDADAAVYRAYVLSFLGRSDEALAEARRALALNPFHSDWYWTALVRALHGSGHYAEAITAYERVRQVRFHHHARLAACHAAVGNEAAARQCVERTLVAKPDFSSAAWTATLPFRHEADRERLRAELLAAGLPP